MEIYKLRFFQTDHTAPTLQVLDLMQVKLFPTITTPYNRATPYPISPLTYAQFMIET